MKDVERLISLLDVRGKPFELLKDKFGPYDYVDHLVQEARKYHRLGEICWDRMPEANGDMSLWLFRGNRQRQDELRRFMVRNALEPYCQDLEMISTTELRDIAAKLKVNRGQMSSVLVEYGYYCDQTADRLEGLDGDWYRFVGFEMPDDVRRMIMQEIKVLLGVTTDQDEAWEMLKEVEALDGIGREWFDRCWAVSRFRGQSWTVG